MPTWDPSILISRPELVRAEAPWCVRLDGLELALILLAQPWLGGRGLRRAEIERRLAALGDHLPVGPVYFQRVKRAAARLAEVGALQRLPEGRSHRFRTTPAGLAAFLLNLGVLEADPTLDGTEFELKRSLAGMWSLAVDRLSIFGDQVLESDELARFFDELEALEIWGEPVVTDELVQRALDVVGLIELQRRKVSGRLAEVEAALAASGGEGEASPGASLERLARRLGPEAGGVLEDPAVAELVRDLTTRTLPALTLEARAARFRRYLGYLDDLAELYSRQLRVVDLDSLRRVAGGRG